MAPYKGKKKFKKRTDAKQNQRLKKLENMVLKTIENKQTEYVNTGLNIPSSGVRDGQFLQLTQGVADGNVTTGGVVQGARIGNSITLLRQQFNIDITQNGNVAPIDDWNRMRILIVEATDGNQPILIGDVLEYSSYATHGDMVFASPYTTKTTTNRRYKVCFDKTVELNYRAKGASRVLKYIKRYKNGKVVEFNDNTAIPTNHQLSLLFISDSAAIPHPQASYSVRSTYKDA